MSPTGSPPPNGCKATRTAAEILETQFLETRAKLLEVAAIFDRIDRAEQQGGMPESTSHKRQQLIEATQVLLSGSNTRAEQIQQLFSRAYDPNWRETLAMDGNPRVTDAAQSPAHTSGQKG